MGALRRFSTADVATISSCSARALHSSARRLEEQPSDAAPAHRTLEAPNGKAKDCTDIYPAPNTRKARAATALKQITKLQAQRSRLIEPGALARGSFREGQMAQRNPSSPVQVNESGFIPEDDHVSTDAQPDANPRFARNTARPTTTRGSTPPSGQMVRAPSTLRISRQEVGNTRGPPMRGPNLRGREGGRPGGPGGQRDRKGGAGKNKGDGGGPKKRDKSSGSDESLPTTIAETPLEHTVSIEMMQQLLRLQRKEWDRVPYEPKYAKGSFAANELLHAGRELFKGESPPVKIWGPLERRIGVVGMFGAEATLKVRRVGGMEREPFGSDEQHMLLDNKASSIDVEGVEKQQEVAAVQ
jgi:hypothetical protein